ncbi:LysM domain-containing protein [Colletotrichum gloeosporioides Cg-14]|uniref:LysM domain-containing protein n=1 Tax=Colletotrichum gloeosporioides (strain Cg-14) TaxID=1237896 RepID=T0KQD1_COLGC|nr:LysM domain-containing protein [Colletotrichum gloeosporioides Cg-14]
MASRPDLLDANGIEEICTTHCRTSLSDLRTKIQTDCDSEKDVFDHNLALYPATYIVDRYIYVYDISCYKHRDTGNACDYVLGEWRNDTNSAPRQCDDCILGPMQLEVNSPIGHTESRADEFKSAVSSCGASGYAYTSPPPYLPSPTSSPESLAVVPQDWSARRMSSECATTYRVREGDTCDSIAAAQEVPSRDLVEANDELDAWCGGLETGRDLCLPPSAKCTF